MILFVNVFITDERYAPELYKDLSSTTRIHSKLDVFKYTLASYSVINWEGAIFHIKLDEKYSPYRAELEAYIVDLFPSNCEIYNCRLDTYEQWLEAIKLPSYSDDTWIWFTCNDDHPFIDYNLKRLDNLIESATRLSIEKNKAITILPSHWSESLANKKRGLKVKDKKYNRWYEKNVIILDDCHE